jgi:hypothetical protein
MLSRRLRCWLVVSSCCLSLSLLGCGQGQDPPTGPDEARADKTACAALEVEATVKQVLLDSGLSQISASFPADEVAAQACKLKNTVSFAAALGDAIQSFLKNADDVESPLALMEEADPDPTCPQARGTEQVRCTMNRKSSILGIVYRDGQRHGSIWGPENNDSVVDNWVFYLHMDDFTDHMFWAVADRAGKSPTFNYGFN